MGRNHFDCLSVDGKFMLKWNLWKQSLGLAHLNVSWELGKSGSYTKSELDLIHVVRVGCFRHMFQEISRGV